MNENMQSTPQPELLSAELQQSVELLQGKKSRWIADSDKEQKAFHQLEALRQRHQQAITDYEQMKTARSAMLFESNGEITSEVKRLRAKMVEQRETADDLEELIALREKELITLPWQTGEAASDYTTAHRHIVEQHINALLNTQLAESCDALFSLLALKYEYLRKSNSAHQRGITEGVNDAATLFKTFITETFFDRVIRMDDATISDPFISAVNLWPEYQAIQDMAKMPTPGQRHKYQMANKVKSNSLPEIAELHQDDEFSIRSKNMTDL